MDLPELQEEAARLLRRRRHVGIRRCEILEQLEMLERELPERVPQEWMSWRPRAWRWFRRSYGRAYRPAYSDEETASSSSSEHGPPVSVLPRRRRHRQPGMRVSVIDLNLRE